MVFEGIPGQQKKMVVKKYCGQDMYERVWKLKALTNDNHFFDRLFH
jgi:hypothetical protein